jgi:acyl-CoA hydrolase
MQRSSTRNPEIKSQMLPAVREITLRFLAAPTDAGYSGNVSGGRVLEWPASLVRLVDDRPGVRHRTQV